MSGMEKLERRSCVVERLFQDRLRWP